MKVIKRGFGPSCTDGETTTFQLVLPYFGFITEEEIRCYVPIFIVFPIANERLFAFCLGKTKNVWVDA